MRVEVFGESVPFISDYYGCEKYLYKLLEGSKTWDIIRNPEESCLEIFDGPRQIRVYYKDTENDMKMYLTLKSLRVHILNTFIEQ